MNPISDYLVSKSNHNEYQTSFGQVEDITNHRGNSVRIVSLLGALAVTAGLFMQIFA